ncbi:hypothetical protein P171DRAFT_442514 [Karstenula rhodostoma CBS 690.94]|uniref:Uncharacterized protein n=1 Tax=Karstenula rhodostoma CBS 690.94 TaxID=1392251 RepID=A0A9P4UBW6_9PLEO|nr:hypothetical protein P171DRAFT_442514 [Karstenula rhodostoma CBS 690.94]
MSISSFFNDLWQAAFAEQDLLKQPRTTHQTTSGEIATLLPVSKAHNSTSPTSMQKPQGASKRVIDLDYASPASSEKFQYRSQSEKQELVYVEYASPDPSEKFQYRPCDEDEKRVDANCTSPHTSDQPQNDTQSQCPYGLFQDHDHWKKKDWAAAVTIGAVAVVCLAVVVGASGSGGGGSFAGHGSGSNRRHDPEDGDCLAEFTLHPYLPPAVDSTEKKEHHQVESGTHIHNALLHHQVESRTYIHDALLHIKDPGPTSTTLFFTIKLNPEPTSTTLSSTIKEPGPTSTTLFFTIKMDPAPTSTTLYAAFTVGWRLRNHDNREVRFGFSEDVPGGITGLVRKVAGRGNVEFDGGWRAGSSQAGDVQAEWDGFRRNGLCTSLDRRTTSVASYGIRSLIAASPAYSTSGLYAPAAHSRRISSIHAPCALLTLSLHAAGSSDRRTTCSQLWHPQFDRSFAAVLDSRAPDCCSLYQDAYEGNLLRSASLSAAALESRSGYAR